MKEQAGAGENEADIEPTIPNLVTRMARGSGAEHKRVARVPMRNILETWPMFRNSVGQNYLDSLNWYTYSSRKLANQSHKNRTIANIF